MKRITFIHSEDSYLTQKTLASYLQSATLNKQSKLNFYAQEVNTEGIGPLTAYITEPQLNFLNNDTNNRLAIVHHYDTIKNKNVLSKLLNQCEENCYLILLQTSLPFSSKYYENFYKSNQAFTDLKRFTAPSNLEMQKRISLFSSEHGIQLNKEVITRLLEHYHSLPDRLYQTLKDMRFYCQEKVHSNKQLEYADIKPLLEDHLEVKIYEFVDDFFSRQRQKAFKSFLATLQCGVLDLVAMAAFLLTETMKLICYHEAITSGNGEEHAFQQLKIFYHSQKERIRSRARSFPAKVLYRLAEELIQIEEVLKSQSIINTMHGKLKVNLLAKSLFEKLIFYYLIE